MHTSDFKLRQGGPRNSVLDTLLLSSTLESVLAQIKDLVLSKSLPDLDTILAELNQVKYLVLSPVKRDASLSQVIASFHF